MRRGFLCLVPMARTRTLRTVLAVAGLLRAALPMVEAQVQPEPYFLFPHREVPGLRLYRLRCNKEYSRRQEALSISLRRHVA